MALCSSPFSFPFLRSHHQSSTSKSSLSKTLISTKSVPMMSTTSSSAISLFSSISHQSLRTLRCCRSSSSLTDHHESPSTRIFIKGLSQSTSEGNLKKAFSQFGEVTRVKILTDKRSRQSLGFAYLWFTREECANSALKEMNGKFFEGRFISVTTAKPGPSKSWVKATPYKF